MTTCWGARVGIILLALVSVTPAMVRAADPTYEVGIDDVLAVSVWDNADVNQVVFVRPDGKISPPLAGEIDVRGMTVAELEARLNELYEKTIKGPRVTVMVKDIRSRPIFFIGGVGRTGPMQLKRRAVV